MLLHWRAGRRGKLSELDGLSIVPFMYLPAAMYGIPVLTVVIGRVAILQCCSDGRVAAGEGSRVGE